MEYKIRANIVMSRNLTVEAEVSRWDRLGYDGCYDSGTSPRLLLNWLFLLIIEIFSC